jgi:PKD repeat protein
MGGGGYLNNERTPCMHDAFSRSLLGWLTPVILTTPGTYTIPKAAADSSFAFRINTAQTNEYFLLENRQRKGQDRWLPSHGLAIWHVNTSKAGKISTKGNNVNNDTANLGLGLMQADGLRDLEFGNDRGDAGDLYPGSTQKHAFSPETNPGSHLYYKVSGVRQNSGVYLTNITENADSSITFKFGASPTASFLASATSGCVPFTASFTNASIFASTYEWSFGDGTTSGAMNTSHTFTDPGTYQVWLKVTDSTGTIHDSIMQSINVVSIPNAAFSYVRTDTNVINFTNTSQGATGYIWKFKNFTTQNQTLTDFKLRDFADSGSIVFTLIAFNNAGCSDTTSEEVAILTSWPLTGVDDAAAGILSFTAYPNPVQGDLNILVDLPASTVLGVTVLDMLGAKVYDELPRTYTAGSQQITINASAFPAQGVYLVRLNGGGHSRTLKVIRN